MSSATSTSGTPRGPTGGAGTPLACGQVGEAGLPVEVGEGLAPQGGEGPLHLDGERLRAESVDRVQGPAAVSQLVHLFSHCPSVVRRPSGS